MKVFTNISLSALIVSVTTTACYFFYVSFDKDVELIILAKAGFYFLSTMVAFGLYLIVEVRRKQRKIMKKLGIPEDEDGDE